MNITILGIAILLYNFALVAGTTWLVAMHDWSGWWYILTITLMLQVRNRDD